MPRSHGGIASTWMWPYYPELLANPVPRYTSYPTAADFRDAFGPDRMLEALDAIETGTQISLYIHIPFCTEICWYCGCNTGRANRRERLCSYLDALNREIAFVAALLKDRAKIGWIAFGGGSPNAIAPVDFVRLADHVMTAFHCSNPVISVELDPRHMSRQWADTLGEVGVTRASLGVQTFKPEIQSAIGRSQPFELVERSVAELREAGVTSLNFDLMYGLPGQSLDDLARTIADTVSLGADRVALFGYAHLPDMIPRQRQIDAANLPDAALRFAQADAGCTWLSEADYVPVGFDHFARASDPLAVAATAGTLRRNFQGFTEDGADILVGLGASAISIFPDRIIQNEKNSGRYRALVGEGKHPAVRGCLRSSEEQGQAKVIEAILCRGRASLADLCDAERYMEMLQPFLERRLLRIEGSEIMLEPPALPYARHIASVFDRFRSTALCPSAATGASSST
jgi:oxygen-independent coproporphyrinogen-3 oxidase